LNNLV